MAKQKPVFIFVIDGARRIDPHPLFAKYFPPEEFVLQIRDVVNPTTSKLQELTQFLLAKGVPSSRIVFVFARMQFVPVEGKGGFERPEDLPLAAELSLWMQKEDIPVFLRPTRDGKFIRVGINLEEGNEDTVPTVKKEVRIITPLSPGDVQDEFFKGMNETVVRAALGRVFPLGTDFTVLWTDSSAKSKEWQAFCREQKRQAERDGVSAVVVIQSVTDLPRTCLATNDADGLPHFVLMGDREKTSCLVERFEFSEMKVPS